MKKLLLTTILSLFVATVYAEVNITGQDMVCKDLNYLSTDCLKSNVVPYEYFDKEVAIERAKADQEITNNTTVIQNKSNEEVLINLIKELLKQSKEEDEIIIKTYFEKE